MHKMISVNRRKVTVDKSRDMSVGTTGDTCKVHVAVCCVAVLALVSGCALLPYEEDFGCKTPDGYGKCQKVTDTYEEAVTGQSDAPYLGAVEGRDGERVSTVKAEPNDSQGPGYQGYRDGVYRELALLVGNAETPMVSEPITLRTWIAAYKEDGPLPRMFGWRYVYTIIEEPTFVLGEYQLRKPELIKAIVEGPSDQ